MRAQTKYAAAGAAAGLVNGLFGGGGGMVLLPLLNRWCRVEGKRGFATCVAVILPLCPDKGGCMTYDLSRAASTYLEGDIELLKRMRPQK